mmetsp:Transcript_10000/g.28669  ORF Transcript_10000/g.28669 Transcript_10000/m.28669 type:complete len:249 (+) Transcript_10000:538-1284(+)
MHTDLPHRCLDVAGRRLRIPSALQKCLERHLVPVALPELLEATLGHPTGVIDHCPSRPAVQQRHAQPMRPLFPHDDPIAFLDAEPRPGATGRETPTTAVGAAPAIASEEAAPVQQATSRFPVVEFVERTEGAAPGESHGLLGKLLHAEIEGPALVTHRRPNGVAVGRNGQKPREPTPPHHRLPIEPLPQVVRVYEACLLRVAAPAVRLFDDELLHHARVVGNRIVEVPRQGADKQHRGQGDNGEDDGD